MIDILVKDTYFFLCPQYYLNNNKSKLYRGDNKMKTITSTTYDLWAVASHLPGLIFNIPKSNNVIKNFNALKKNYPSVTKYYPQLLILADLLIQNCKQCIYLNLEVCSQQLFLEETHDKDFTGTGYAGLVTRWILHKECIDYLTNLRKENYTNNTLRHLISFQRKRILKVIRNSLEWEGSDYIMDFNREIYKTFIFLPIKVLFLLLTKPVSFLKKITKYFY